ncbi:hypothetical protein [Methanofollis fontis]|uniref:Uncharacterized protein n=1 Tax=Methanofollis fontis TaxID=2052832 RepID=A0A483CV81_9EURY|nr:hypothetical protein [Methanofollis fontis]TAJ45387.1 hypothetical protein CUJ86_01185 [Methanofollis fontis]
MNRQDDDAITAIDFLAGFTIFMLGLIMAVGMVPGMLAGLQSATIDYDGVAYRTSVILVEDPGWWYDDATLRADTHWEGETTAMVRVQRMGLALSKDTPCILSDDKVRIFFNQTGLYTYPDDYRERVFFSDIPYLFNISLKTAGGTSYSVGEGVPAGEYGYIRRAVQVKGDTSATLDFADAAVQTDYTSSPPGAVSRFNVSLNFTELLDEREAYRIDPFGEQITITLENLNETRFNGAANARLTSVTLWKRTETGASQVPPALPDSRSTLYVDGLGATTPTDITRNLTLVLDPGFFQGKAAETNTMEVRFLFTNAPNVNTTLARTFAYSPTDGNLTAPPLEDAWLEVAVW